VLPRLAAISAVTARLIFVPAPPASLATYPRRARGRAERAADCRASRYLGPEYNGTNGPRCRRLVVVQYERNQEEVDKGAPASAGIITSFGWRIG
jgi:hypothetical protein